jgi:hypothetical protein
VSWIPSHSIFDDTFQVNNPHRTQSTGLFVTQSNMMGHFAGRIDWKKQIWRQVMTSLCTNDLPAVSLIDCLLAQWPLIVLKSSLVDSQWAELNGNTPCLCVSRPTHVVSFRVKWVIRYWSFIPEEATHITHCIVWWTRRFSGLYINHYWLEVRES